jgi:hypothetical protein
MSLAASFSFITDTSHNQASCINKMPPLPGHSQSYIFNPSQRQQLNLEPNTPGVGCFRLGTIEHELLHALGFYHQQSATERDDYVTIIWENIEPGNVSVSTCNKHNKDAPVPCAHRTHKILHLLHTLSTLCTAAMAVQATCKYCRKYFGCNLVRHSKPF